MPKVYVTQIPHRTEEKTGAFVPSINIGPAAEYGEIVVMMPPRAGFHNTTELSNSLWTALKDFDHEADCLVPLGDPLLCSTASAILARGGNFNILRWDRNIGRYLTAKVVI
jgi:hypothetical protein